MGSVKGPEGEAVPKSKHTVLLHHDETTLRAAEEARQRPPRIQRGTMLHCHQRGCGSAPLQGPETFPEYYPGRDLGANHGQFVGGPHIE